MMYIVHSDAVSRRASIFSFEISHGISGNRGEALFHASTSLSQPTALSLIFRGKLRRVYDRTSYKLHRLPP